MPKRIVRETNYIDYTTGEIKANIKVYSGSTFRESFLMLRTTKGLDFLDRFRNVLQLKVLLTLSQDVIDGVVRIDNVSLTKYSKDLKASIPYLRKIIRFLMDNDFVKRQQRGIYMINPTYIHKGNTGNLHERIKEFEDL